MTPVTVRSKLLPMLAAGLLLISGRTARADDWTHLGLGASRARLSAERSGVSFSRPSWTAAVTSTDKEAYYHALVASPAVADGVVVVNTGRGFTYGLREGTGKLMWGTPPSGDNLASPAVGWGMAFRVGGNQQLQAVWLATGSPVWERYLGGMCQASPMVAGDALFVAAGEPNQRVLRLDPATGKTIWQSGDGTLLQSVAAGVAVADGHVVVAELGGRYHSFAVADGRWQWTAEAPGSVQSASPLIAGGRVHALPGGPTARMYAFQLDGGTPVAGWPVDLAPLLPRTPGATPMRWEYRASSLAGADDLIVFTLRLDEMYDENGDGDLDRFALRERVVAVDARDGRVRWSIDTGSLDVKQPGTPSLGALIPTPLLYRTDADQLMVAATGTLSSRLRVLAAADGAERWGVELSAPTRSSPVFANGRLIVATDAGLVHSFLSRTNLPPGPPVLGFFPADGQVSPRGTTLRWGAGVDPEDQPLSYQVRIDDDAEVLHTWDREIDSAPGQRQWATGPLQEGRVYAFAVRARDPMGAWSAWSAPQAFRVVATPSIRIGERELDTLDEATASAHAGETITLGAGLFQLGSTLQLPAGVTLAGAAPHRTILSGKNLAVAVAPGAGSALRNLTVRDAPVGVSVDAEKVLLQNVILRDSAEAGLDVGPAGSAELISATVLKNGTGVRARGATHVRNAIVTDNDAGLAAAAPDLLDLRYNDVYGNRVDDYRNARPSQTDLAVTVAFDVDDDAQVRLRAGQPTTDKGDPADQYGDEPQPNGSRINLGAFGNTPWAELSALVEDPGPAGEPLPPAPEPGRELRAAGGGLCALAGPDGAPDGGLWLVLGALLLTRRRRGRTGR
jgi:outer membrane protein assembly factor BamB